MRTEYDTKLAAQPAPQQEKNMSKITIDRSVLVNAIAELDGGYYTNLAVIFEALLDAPEAQPAPQQWTDAVVVNLVREGVNKHKARELAAHFATMAQPVAQDIDRKDEKTYTSQERVQKQAETIQVLLEALKLTDESMGAFVSGMGAA